MSRWFILNSKSEAVFFNEIDSGRNNANGLAWIARIAAKNLRQDNFKKIMTNVDSIIDKFDEVSKKKWPQEKGGKMKKLQK